MRVRNEREKRVEGVGLVGKGRAKNLGKLHSREFG